MTNFVKNFVILFLIQSLSIFIFQKIDDSFLFEKIILSTLLIIMFLILFHKFNYEKLSIVLIIYIIFTLTLVNIDRSKSFYILFWVENNKIMINDKNNINLEKYPEIKVRINESDFKIRINEHIKRGIIKKDEEKLILSNSGKLLLKISDNLAKIFNLRNWVGI